MDWAKWLADNGAERLDATRTDLFRPIRCDFHRMRYEIAKCFCIDQTVLDFGCGTGYGSQIISRYATATYGVDICPEAVEYAKTFHRGKDLTFSTALPQEHSIDVVVCFELVEHVMYPDQVLQDFKRMFCKLGPKLLIISTPNKWPIEGNKYHLHSWDYSTFDYLLRNNGFEVIHCFAQNSGQMDSKNNHQKGAGYSEDYPNAECLLFICRSI